MKVKPKKSSTIYNCENCGSEYIAWQGRCDSCGEWSTIVEQKTINIGLGLIQKGYVNLGHNTTATGGNGDSAGAPQKIGSVSGITGGLTRITTGLDEFDRVLGGGLAQGSVVLLTGEPGVGKSTLLMQMCIRLATGKQDIGRDGKTPEILYISAEEVIEQVADRAKRIGKSDLSDANLSLLNSYHLEHIIETISSSQAQVVVLDSIQTIASSEVTGVPGGIAQTKYCASVLTSVTKSLGKTLVMVGHINKDGGIAGPKVLEHLVDVVLQFTGEEENQLRVLRAHKNRFGSTVESGLFLMEQDGLQEISNPGEYFLASSENSKQVGACRCLILDGNRPLVVELQALAVKTVYAYPKRVASGVPLSRLQVLTAALDKYAGLGLHEYDIYVNVARGVKLTDPAIDMALAVAIGSSVKSRQMGKVIAFGELNLSGSFSPAAFESRRLQEAKRLGYKYIVTPQNVPHLSKLSQVLAKKG